MTLQELRDWHVAQLKTVTALRWPSEIKLHAAAIACLDAAIAESAKDHP